MPVAVFVALGSRFLDGEVGGGDDCSMQIPLRRESR